MRVFFTAQFAPKTRALVLTKITLKVIETEFADAVRECVKVLRIEFWLVKPLSVVLMKRKTAYGLASLSGVVSINEAFVGTTEIDKLRKTLRHELAHLAVGLKESHNQKFIHTNQLFGGHAEGNELGKQVRDKIKFKWSLWAHFSDGSSELIKGAHRRDKKYGEYRPTAKFFMSVDGKRVEYFHYKENDV
jgi:hypothetical protein